VLNGEKKSSPGAHAKEKKKLFFRFRMEVGKARAAQLGKIYADPATGRGNQVGASRKATGITTVCLEGGGSEESGPGNEIIKHNFISIKENHFRQEG